MIRLSGHLDRHHLTDVYREKETSFNAPHNYEVRSSDFGELLNIIHFQEGPIDEVGINGVMNENLIVMVMDRLEHFQDSEYACEENELALKHLDLALEAMNKRTIDRIDRGVEGTHIV